MAQDASRGLFGTAGRPTKTSLCVGKGTHKLKKYIQVLGLMMVVAGGSSGDCVYQWWWCGDGDAHGGGDYPET